jgi:hypothetical protein
MDEQVAEAKEVAIKAGEVGVAVVNQAWPNNKVLIAVLPPTVALLVAAGGMWQSSRADRNAAIEAEKARAAEVEKDQETARKDQDLRMAELLLPRYETLLTDVRLFQRAVLDCMVDIEASVEFDSSCDLDDEFDRARLSMDKALVVSSPEPLVQAALAVEGSALEAVDIAYVIFGSDPWVRRDVVDKLDTVTQTIEDDLNGLSDAVRLEVILDD